MAYRYPTLRALSAGIGALVFCLVAAAQSQEFNLPPGDIKASLDAFATQSGRQLIYREDDLKGLSTKGVKATMSTEEALNALLEGTPLKVRRDGSNAILIYRGSLLKVPAQDASSAILEFSRQSGLKVSAPPETLVGKRTAVLDGVFDSRDALRLMLAGSALEVASDDGTTVVLKAAAKDPAADLGTVTVMAQKRPEAAQAVPIAMTTFSAKTLENFRIQDLRDVSRLTPGLLVSAFSENSPTIAIRGASNTFSQIGVNKPVGVVIDDVFIPRNSAASFSLFDLESIAVLKGPQGTLFGRNVTGGAIVITTRKPSLDERFLEAQATVGNFNARQLDGLVSVPLNDAAAVKFSASLRKRDGTGVDRLTGQKEDDSDSQNLRGQFRFLPVAGVDVLLSADYSHDSNGGRTLSSTTLGDDGNRRTSELGVNQNFGRTITGTSAQATWGLWGGEMTSITAYRQSSSSEGYSGVGANYTLLTKGSQSVVSDNDQVGTFSQEVRFASPKWSTGDFVTGLYFSDESGQRQLGTNGLLAKTGALSSSILSDQRVSTVSYALFADGTLHVAPTVDLITGARYTHDEKTASLIRSDLLRPVNTFTSGDITASWHQITPRVSLNWNPTHEAMGYVSVTKGFTSGGFNGEAATLAAFKSPFDPEIVTNYEAGVKTQWLENRLRVNLSVFRMQYKDKQELVFDSTTGILNIFNASRATINGGELEVAYKPARWLGLSMTYANMNAVYDDFVLGTVNNTGHQLASSPHNTYSFSADLDYPLRGAGYLVGAASYSHTAKYNTGAAQDPNLGIPKYGLVNASFGFQTLDRGFKLTAWVKNAANTDYVLTKSTQVVRAEYLGEPRTFGLTLSTKF